MPDLVLVSSAGIRVNLSDLEGTVVFYCYPMTGQPEVELPDDWDLIPGVNSESILSNFSSRQK